MHLNKLDYLFVGSTAAVVVAITIVQRLALPIAITVALTVNLLIILQLEIYRRIQIQLRAISYDQKQNYQQIEALFSLVSTIDITSPLPPLREWAISPDFANTIVSVIYQRKPKLVVELGSGASTVISGYCLQANQQGTVISIDHDEKYAQKTRDTVAMHNLHDTAKVILSPLKDIMLEGKSWHWYDLTQVQLPGKIDLLIVDGPPAHTQEESVRYPALPLLHDHLSKDVTILVDDGGRAQENQMIKNWVQKFPDFSCFPLETEKGGFLLRRLSCANTEMNLKA